jgi:hypothetical protein
MPPSTTRTKTKLVVAGSVSGILGNLQNLTMTKFDGNNPPAAIVVASGCKTLGGTRTPLTVLGTVVDSTHISFQVWDANGQPYDPATWDGLEIRYAVIEA